MDKNKLNTVRRTRRKRGIRKRVYGTVDCPRLTVSRSLRHIYAQIIDDDAGVTICSASTRHKSIRDGISNGGNVAAAGAIGKALAESAIAKGLKKIRFDRNGYRYHGRLAALADAVREGGLEF